MAVELQSPAGWAGNPSSAQCWESSVGVSSKAHWEGLELALGCCGSDALFREAALISPGRVSPSVPGLFGMSRMHLSHGTPAPAPQAVKAHPPGSGEVWGLPVIPVKSRHKTSAYSREGKSLL